MPPISVVDVETEIHGSTPMFSDRWVRAHNFPERVTRTIKRRNASGGITLVTDEFSSADVFSSLLRTGGKDVLSNRRLSYLLESYGMSGASSIEKQKTTDALTNGFLPLVRLKDGLESSRIDELIEALKRGPTAEGIAHWLIYDQETRRCLTLLLRLEGYEVADEMKSDGTFISDRIMGLDSEGKLPMAGYKFSDFLHLRRDQIGLYLKAVADAVGTDRGIVEIAYIIFRILGHPHENNKFAEELIKKYTGILSSQEISRVSPFIRKFNELLRGYASEYSATTGDLDPREVAPFIVKFKDVAYDPPKTLEEILAIDGVLGLTLSLSRIPATKIVREWQNMQILLDMMDKVTDIREGFGGASTIPVSQRLDSIKKLELLNTALAKRLLEPATIERITHPGKIRFIKAMNEPEKGGWKEFFADLGFAPRQKKRK